MSEVPILDPRRPVSWRSSASFPQSVRQVASANLRQPPCLRELADIIGISARTLQRRLADKGTSYTALINQTRFEYARRRLVSCRGSGMTGLAMELGFHDAAHFSRAFRRWTGMSPSAYLAKVQREINGSRRPKADPHQRLLEETSVIPWEADPQTWQFTHVGPQAEPLLGYPVEQWYEKDFWVSYIYPEDRDFAINFCETSSKIVTNYEFEYRMVAADGRVVWLHDVVNVITNNGTPQRLKGFMKETKPGDIWLHPQIVHRELLVAK